MRLRYYLVRLLPDTIAAALQPDISKYDLHSAFLILIERRAQSCRVSFKCGAVAERLSTEATEFFSYPKTTIDYIDATPATDRCFFAFCGTMLTHRHVSKTSNIVVDAAGSSRLIDLPSNPV